MKVKNGIIPITDDRIPTIVAYSLESNKIVIGYEARKTGLKGKAAVFNFKLDLGKGDAEFSKKKKYWMAPTGEYDEKTTLLTAKKATEIYLRELLSGVDIPEQILIGEPAIRETAWKENFRRHMREIFQSLKIGATPLFFPEPFAVFQYYRNEFLEKTQKSEIVLVIDVGGGTFNTCIIKTTDEGYLSRGGGTSLPIGLQAEECGGCEVDRDLLAIIIKRANENGIQWKDDPFARATKEGSNVMLHIEDAKIYLSDSIGQNAKLSDDFSSIHKEITIQKGQLHPEHSITTKLSGNDLKTVLRNIWRRKWGNIIIETINEAEDRLRKLNVKYNKIDKVIVAGGSSNLPFMKDEIITVLPTKVQKQDIKIAPYLGRSVAAGLAYECMEQTDRNPKLGINKIAPCLLNELYLGFRKGRRDQLVSPKIKHEGKTLRCGQLISEPFIIDEYKLSYEFEMPFDINDRVFYCFCDQPFENDEKYIMPLNLNNDVFSLETDKKIVKKWRLIIEIRKNGMVKPAFIYKEKGKGANKEGTRVDLPEFYFQNFNLREGNSFIGIDFGTSNSYMVRFLKTIEDQEQSEYPEYSINQKTIEKLRTIEKDINTHKQNHVLSVEKVIEYSKEQMLHLVFHSNKIEGSPLTKGETEKAIQSKTKNGLNKNQLEAFNLEQAYKWMLENYNAYALEPQNFVRMLNKMILEGIDNDAGKYRTKSVKLSGMDYIPPVSTSVPIFMDMFSDELKEGPVNRSSIEFATAMHTKLVSIHPFVDGNGRTARLLMNAILISGNMPPIIVNFADKQRYLSALSDSNNGDISFLVDFFIECYKESFDEYYGRFSIISEQEEDSSHQTNSQCDIEPGTTRLDPIESALQDVGALDKLDPIKLAMKSKIENLKRIREANYKIWDRGFTRLKAEFEIIINEFNLNNDYHSAGFSMRLIDYDMLSFEKYSDICAGKKASRTWYFGIDIYYPNGRERLLFFFVPCYRKKNEKEGLSPVSLVIARSDGSEYCVLKNEPIKLREIAMLESQPIFFNSNTETEKGDMNQILKTFLAEVIKAYL